MKRYTPALAVCLAAVWASCVVQPHTVRSSIPAPSTWQRVEVPGSGFSIRMPGTPKLSKESSKDFDGTTIRKTLGRVFASNRALFGFVVLKAEGGFIRAPCGRASKAATDSDDDRETRWEKEFDRKGFPTQDRIVDMPDDGASMYIRIMVGKSHLYGVFMAYPMDSEHETEHLRKAFLASAKVDAEQAFTPLGDGRLALDDWRYTYPPDAGFAVDMPGFVHNYKTTEKFDDVEAKVRVYDVRDKSENEVFRVLVHTFKKAPTAKTIVAAKKNYLERGLSVHTDAFVHQRGFGGKAFVLSSKTHDVHVRFFVSKQRLYEVAVWTQRGAEGTVADARKRFLNSFRVL